MSQIGKKHIDIPQGIFVNFLNDKIIVNGAHGKLSSRILSGLQIIKQLNHLKIIQFLNDRYSSSRQGLMRSIITNMIIGVADKFFKTLKITGVGYKFYIEKKKILLNVGKTTNKQLSIPEHINVENYTMAQITLSSIYKTDLNIFASRIRSISPLEPYNGHGIFYEGETLFRKSGKRKTK